MDTYHAQLQSAEFASSMMKLGCYLFMAIVGLIGFMNMANTMIMNITTKKQEYGILQAVGMTCLLYTSPSPRDYAASRMPSSA